MGQEIQTAERRRAVRRPKHVLVAPGLWLEDESREGAGFLTYGPVPSKGTCFSYTVRSRASSGRVKWICPVGRGVSRFGIEKASSDP